MSIRSAQISPLRLTYEATIQRLLSVIRQKKRVKARLALARLVAGLMAAVAVYYFWPAIGLGLMAAAGFTVLLIVLVFTDDRKTEQIKQDERLVRINQHELDALDHQLSQYPDGREFTPAAHAYASDLDLFGPFSLFQFLNRCQADQSKKQLADDLLNAGSSKTIREKQEAVKELAIKTDWSQQFQSSAMANPISFETEKKLRQWIEQPPGIFEKPGWRAVIAAYALISLTVLGLYLADVLTNSGFLLCLVCFFGISSAISFRITPTWALLSKIEPQMDALYAQIQGLEAEPFESVLLQQIKTSVRGSDKQTPVATVISQFRNILKRFDFRLNLLVFAFLNGFLLWDLQQMIALIDWKKKNKQLLDPWFRAIAATEVLISLAALARNEPAWCFPEINDRYFNLKVKELGHPLIPAQKNVLNSFWLEGASNVAIVTGSNMAGKSTFLRSLGTNLILAFMGAPVCAEFFEASEMRLLSSMRVADNLAENSSTFHAELKKLEYIIDIVNRKEPVFILLDEVLRGTNSADRHAGTKALIRQLIRLQAVAVIATHDTGLARTEYDHNPQAIRNYHFDGQIRGEELFFDYRLRNGVCESLNATLLMKKIGIHFEE